MPRHEQKEISFDVPRHWEERTIVAFAAPKEPAQAVAANLVMTEDRLRDGETLGDYADRQLAELVKRLDAFELVRRETSTLGGAPAVTIRFAARASSAPLLQRLVVVEGRRRSVFCFTATTARADAEQNEPLFDRILSTVRLASPPQEGAA
jgi:hypothetical protein